MFIKDTNEQARTITVAIPLTKVTEKTRIKKRSIINEYGFPVATRKEVFTQQCYVEWQIGYDIVCDDQDKLTRTTLPNIIFIGANGKRKAIYELSEYIYYFYKWKVIKKEQLEQVQEFLDKIDTNKLIDVNSDYSIERSHPIPKQLFDINFQYSQVKYPLLIHKFHPFEIITEIIIKEKQSAVGVQPMLYFCFPITELSSSKTLLGRTAETKENADFVIKENNITVFIETLKIFGILSQNHRKDVISIINLILSE